MKIKNKLKDVFINTNKEIIKSFDMIIEVSFQTYLSIGDNFYYYLLQMKSLLKISNYDLKHIHLIKSILNSIINKIMENNFYLIVIKSK
jgi:hypothetical protein